MKFTGIVASLAVASTASALAIPQTPVDANATLMKLNSALTTVEGLVGGLLGGVCKQVDLTKVQTELVDIKGQLVKLVPVSVPASVPVSLPTKRDVEDTANEVTSPVITVPGNEVKAVEGAAKPVTDVTGDVGTVKNTAGGLVGTVEKVASGPVDTVTGTAGLKRQDVGQVTTLAQNLVSKIKSGALDAAGLENVLNMLGQTGGLSAVTTLLKLLQ